MDPPCLLLWKFCLHLLNAPNLSHAITIIVAWETEVSSVYVTCFFVSAGKSLLAVHGLLCELPAFWGVATENVEKRSGNTRVHHGNFFVACLSSELSKQSQSRDKEKSSYFCCVCIPGLPASDWPRSAPHHLPPQASSANTQIPASSWGMCVCLSVIAL